MTKSDDDRFSGASAQHVEIDSGKANKNASVRTAHHSHSCGAVRIDACRSATAERRKRCFRALAL